MRAFRFADEESLLVALTSGLIPAEIAANPAIAARATDEARQAIWVSPADSGLDRVAQQRLISAGAADDEIPVDLPQERAACWAELIRARPVGEPPVSPGPILLLLPDEGSLLELAGELLRLGCTRQTFCDAGQGRYLIRALAPPYYTLTRAFDEAEGLRAFQPQPAGQERIWVELGVTHPLVEHLQAPRDGLVLVSRRPPWLRLGGLRWHDVKQVVELLVSPTITIDRARQPPRRLEVPLRLAPGASGGVTELWVLRQRALEQVDSLVRSLPQQVASRLLFAVSDQEDEPLVVLKSRPGLGSGSPPELALDGEAYQPHSQLRHLFLPLRSRIEPPLRRDQLRELLAPRTDRLVWLRARGGGAFAPEAIDESAFSPLERWIEYVIDTGVAVLSPWIQSTTFDLEPFEQGEVELVPTATKRKPRSPKRTRAGPSKTDAEAGREDEGASRPRSQPKKKRKTTPATTSTAEAPETTGEARLLAELGTLEAEFLELDLPGDAPERGQLWRRLAELYEALGRRGEAGLCWPRVLWELDGEAMAAAAAAWADAERSLAPAPDESAVEAILDEARPSRDDSRLLAAHLVATAAAGGRLDAAVLARWQQWLGRHEDNLDLRALWLTRLALAQLSGGDPLSLARSRDRILSRLHHGLSPERELPPFLRRSEGDLRSAGVERMAAELEELLVRAEKADRVRSFTEAPNKLTFAYVRFSFAFAMARLGRADRSRALTAEATDRLDQDDPLHHFLVRAYGERIEHAQSGLPPETPLSTEIAAELNGMDKMMRFKVDRLRQFSQILEPQERLNAFDSYSAVDKGVLDPRGEEFGAMRGMTDQGELTAAVEEVFAKAARIAEPDERARLYDGVMDFFPQLAESQVTPYLSEMVELTAGIETPRRAQLLEEALMLAGHFGHEELAEQLVGALRPMLTDLGPEHAAEVASTLGGMLRSLRRVGLRDEAKHLVDALVESARGEGTELLLLRLQLGAAHAALDHPELSTAAHEEALIALRGAMLDRREPWRHMIIERLKVSRALAQSLAVMPPDTALSGLRRLEREQLKYITDAFNTNSHFCLSVLHFLESLALGYASEELTLGPKVRQWLEEEEYLIRRRVHRDLRRISD